MCRFLSSRLHTSFVLIGLTSTASFTAAAGAATTSALGLNFLTARLRIGCARDATGSVGAAPASAAPAGAAAAAAAGAVTADAAAPGIASSGGGRSPALYRSSSPGSVPPLQRFSKLHSSEAA